MTLQLNLIQLKHDLPADTAIIVEGSQAGRLCSRFTPQGKVDLKIICNRTDLLRFRVFDGEKFKTLEGEEGSIGENYFSPQRFLNENRYNAKLYKNDTPILRNLLLIKTKWISSSRLMRSAAL